MAERQAFEVTEEDIVLVLIHMGHSASEDVIRTVFDQLDTDAVQQAASQGNDADERDDYAQQEIAAQIKRMSDLPAGD